MKILFLGGDKRQIEIIKDLSKNNYDIDVIGYDKIKFDSKIKNLNLEKLNISKYNIIILPVNGVREDYSITAEYAKEKIILPPNLFYKTNEKVVLFTGIKTIRLNAMLESIDRKLCALMEEKDVIRQNSIPTVEGIIGDLIYNTEKTINEADILVIGYGNIGKRLVSILEVLGANVTIGIILKDDYDILNKKQKAVLYTNDFIMMKEVLNNSDIIVNTAPDLILNQECLNQIKKDCYILDIASHPHGVDFEYAEKLKLRNKLLLGIPSIVAPKTAGKILSKKISMKIGGQKWQK